MDVADEALPEVDVLDNKSLIAFLAWADILLLRPEFVKEAPVEVISARRQDLPASTFHSTEELMEGSLTICSLPYAWQSGGHPDPRALVAGALRGFANTDFLARSLFLGPQMPLPAQDERGLGSEDAVP